MHDLIPYVATLIEEAAEKCVMPVFGNQAANSREKTPGEWVTKADRDCEAFLEPALLSLIPGSLAVGEEAVSADSRILDRLSSDGDVWLIDPLDGTSNFAKGLAPFALMVALVRKGDTIASWILDPLSQQLSISEKGSGAWINNEKITVRDDTLALKDMTGAVLSRFLPEELRLRITEAKGEFSNLTTGSKCAGFDYPEIAKGAMNFALYWRTLPWDHAPGVLFLEEAGGYVGRPDGSKYKAADHAKSGLLAAANFQTWSKVKSTLLK